MTCDDCIYCVKKRYVDEDFNNLTYWYCQKTSMNILYEVVYSEQFRLNHPSSPLKITEYDHRNRPCKHHKSGGTDITRFFDKDDYKATEPTPTDKPELPHPFLERD